VFLLDEWDGADSNMLLVLNAALANGHMAVPNRAKKPQAKRHKNCYIFAAGNTWGTGADWEYVGRNQLDASSLSRFACATLEITYDEELEKFLTSDVPELFEAFMKVRASANANKVRRILGTRE
jgi:MoxR-like ATPase